MDWFLVEKFTILRLQQRCMETASGNLLFRMKDGKGAVYLTPGQWHDLGSEYRRRTAPTRRFLTAAIWLQIPLAIAGIAFIVATPGTDRVLDGLDGIAPGLSVLLMTTWPLLIGLFVHARGIARARRSLERYLAGFARVPQPARSGRAGLNLFEIAALLLVGPHILINIAGSLNPHLFDNTPWSGRGAGVLDLLGCAVIGGLLLLRTRRRAPVADPLPESAPRTGGFGKRGR